MASTSGSSWPRPAPAAQPERATQPSPRARPSRAARPSRPLPPPLQLAAQHGRREVAEHLLSIDDLGADGIEEVLRLTDSFVEVSARSIPKVPTLRGKTVVSLFYEDSTRTRLSFETAAKRLGADTMTFSVGTSSVKKGESVRDTLQTIEAMGVDAVVVRHSSAGVPVQVARWGTSAVIN